MQVEKHRPTGVSILAVLAGIAFVANAFVALLFLGAVPAALFGRTGFFGEAALGLILWGALALIWAWVAIGLWNLDPQAWLFVVVLAIMDLCLIGLSLLGASTWEAMLPSIVVNGIILIYALTSGVKDAFGIQPPQQT